MYKWDFSWNINSFYSVSIFTVGIYHSKANPMCFSFCMSPKRIEICINGYQFVNLKFSEITNKCEKLDIIKYRYFSEKGNMNYKKVKLAKFRWKRSRSIQLNNQQDESFQFMINSDHLKAWLLLSYVSGNMIIIISFYQF